MFEAHIVSALSKDCEHLILIGDHVQLKPNPSVYTLAKDYKFDVSLFERLINNNTKRQMLDIQHRMRPEISILMKHFYDKPIKDHSSVTLFRNVIGLKHNVLFFNHKNAENSDSSSLDNKSKCNKFEAQLISRFADYLIKQSYDASKITILTMYLGQLVEIRKHLKQFKLDSLKVSTVDNFQGEENEIIILSLVRSNARGNK